MWDKTNALKKYKIPFIANEKLTTYPLIYTNFDMFMLPRIFNKLEKINFVHMQ